MQAVIQLCSRIVVINGGKFLTEGSPENVLRQQVVIDAYLGSSENDAKS